MDQPVPPPADPAGPLQLGEVLGQNHSFALMAGRCSAAQAETLLRIRESRLYLQTAPSWKLFCPEFLHISSSQADRIIRLWQLHGPAIFELKQLIRISPDAYNEVEPFIRENALHFNDEAIELDPRNSRKIVDAVAEIRRAAPPKPKPEPTVIERLAALDHQCKAIAAEFDQIASRNCRGEERLRLELTLNCASAALRQIERQYKLYPDE